MKALHASLLPQGPPLFATTPTPPPHSWRVIWVKLGEKSPKTEAGGGELWDSAGFDYAHCHRCGIRGRICASFVMALSLDWPVPAVPVLLDWLLFARYLRQPFLMTHDVSHTSCYGDKITHNSAKSV